MSEHFRDNSNISGPMTNNLELWDSVAKTDPSSTKPVSLGGRRFTAIDPYSQIRKATAKFGPAGKGWGWKGRFVTDFLGEDRAVISWHGIVWWEVIDNAVPCAGAAELAGRRKNGDPFVDTDAFKKALTDAITKGLSYLGFNADVFLGLFDDNKYVQERRREEAQEKRSEAAATPRTPDPERPVDWKTEAPAAKPAPGPATRDKKGPHAADLDPAQPFGDIYWEGHPGIDIKPEDPGFYPDIPAPHYRWQGDLIGIGKREMDGKPIREHPWLYLLNAPGPHSGRIAWLRATVNELHDYVPPGSAKYEDFIGRAKTTLEFVERPEPE